MPAASASQNAKGRTLPLFVLGFPVAERQGYFSRFTESLCDQAGLWTLRCQESQHIMDLTAFINTYRGPLIGLIASWGAPWADAVEIAQDSFSAAWLNRESCRGNWRQQDVFGRRLRGVALNQYRNWARDRRRRRTRFVTLAPGSNEPVAINTPEPSEHLAALHLAIERLPANQRQVVLMHYLEESSVKQVADLLSVSTKTVEGRLFQARRTLRRLLDDKSSASSIVRILLCL